MKQISSDNWRYQGSSVIFNNAALNGLASSQVSLRAALAWAQHIPETPCARTILITGLETVLETLGDTEAEDFLLHRIQPLLRKIQRTWTDVGIVLGFASPTEAFELSLREENVLLRRRNGNKINLSNGLWNGSAPHNMARIMGETQSISGGVSGEGLIGYHVSRIA
jgi:hypothetical protein